MDRWCDWKGICAKLAIDEEDDLEELEEVMETAKDKLEKIWMQGEDPVLHQDEDGKTSGKITRTKVQRIWCGCALFLTLVQVDRFRRSVRLNEFLKAVNITFDELTSNVGHALERLGEEPAGHPVMKRLELVQSTHSSTTLLFNKFRRIWEMSREFAPQERHVDAILCEQSFEMAWLLYIVVKREFEEESPDIAWSYQLLVSIVYIVRFARRYESEENLDPRKRRLSPIKTLNKRAKYGGGENSTTTTASTTTTTAAVAGEPSSSSSKGDERQLLIYDNKNDDQKMILDDDVEEGEENENDEVGELLSTPNVDKFMSMTKITMDIVSDFVSRIKERVKHLIAEKVFDDVTSPNGTEPEQLKVEQVLTWDYLSAKRYRDQLSSYYQNQYVKCLDDFDERSFLDGTLGSLLVSNTPRKVSFAEPSELGGGGNFLHPTALPPPIPASSKAKSDTAKATAQIVKDGVQRVTKSLFNEQMADDDDDDDEMQQQQVTFQTVMKSTKHQNSPPQGSTGSTSGKMTHLSPARTHQNIQAFTPVSIAVEASNWLSRELQGELGVPSETLLRYFGECEANPLDTVKARVEQMLQDLVKAGRTKPNSRATKELFRMEDDPKRPSANLGISKHLESGTKLYYRVLESIVLGESSRLGTQKFDVLLHSDMFHRALFACCMEVIFKSKEVLRLMYPTVTTVLGVPPFELLKVVESFVKYVPMLPRLLQQHLYFLEKDILEEAAWKSGSPLFALLEERKVSGIGLFLDNQDDQEHNPQRANLRPLDLFLRKLLALAHDHMKAIYLELGFSMHTQGFLYKDMWEVLRRGIVDHPSLLRDRHVDQIILCTVYAVSKIKKIQPEVTFKRLVNAYKAMRSRNERDAYAPHIVNRVCTRSRQRRGHERIIQDIKLHHNDEKGDIIQYYNSIYISEMKETIVAIKRSDQLQIQQQLASSSTTCSSSPPNASGSSSGSSSSSNNNSSNVEVPGTPPPGKDASFQSPSRSASRHPPRHAGGTRPLSSSSSSSSATTGGGADKIHMTPRTKELYSGESPAAANPRGARGSSGSRRSRLFRNPIADLEEESDQPRRVASRLQNLLLRHQNRDGARSPSSTN